MASSRHTQDLSRDTQTLHEVVDQTDFSKPTPTRTAGQSLPGPTDAFAGDECGAAAPPRNPFASSMPAAPPVVSRDDVMLLVDSFGNRPPPSMMSLEPLPGDTFAVGGHAAEFVDPLQEKHSCPVCKLALRDPVQTPCGHRFCRTCMEEILR